jgi:nicotinamidase-related amidase
MGMWHHKILIEAVSLADEELWAIDPRIALIEGEYVMMKKRASAFSGAPLSGYLRSAGIDTILATGVTATVCIRITICDGLADSFGAIAVRESIGNRVPGAVAWNLFDIDAKFANVEPVDTCVNYFNNVEGHNDRRS